MQLVYDIKCLISNGHTRFSKSAFKVNFGFHFMGFGYYFSLMPLKQTNWNEQNSV